MISLAAIMPQILDAKIIGYGEPITIPFLPLSYIQWQNAAIGLTAPQAKQRNFVVDAGKPVVAALDYNDKEYRIALINYDNALKLRRIAIALAGGGMEELQGQSLDEQVALIEGMDMGILNALYDLLEGMARKRSAAWFRRDQSPKNGHADLPSNEVVVEPVASTS